MTFALGELGFLRNRRPVSDEDASRSLSGLRSAPANGGSAEEGDAAALDAHTEDSEDLGEWQDVELVVSRDEVEAMCKKWKVKHRPVLDESCVLL